MLQERTPTRLTSRNLLTQAIRISLGTALLTQTALVVSDDTVTTDGQRYNVAPLYGVHLPSSTETQKQPFSQQDVEAFNALYSGLSGLDLAQAILEQNGQIEIDSETRTLIRPGHQEGLKGLTLAEIAALAFNVDVNDLTQSQVYATWQAMDALELDSTHPYGSRSNIKATKRRRSGATISSAYQVYLSQEGERCAPVGRMLKQSEIAATNPGYGKGFCQGFIFDGKPLQFRIDGEDGSELTFNGSLSECSITPGAAANLRTACVAETPPPGVAYLFPSGNFANVTRSGADSFGWGALPEMAKPGMQDAKGRAGSFRLPYGVQLLGYRRAGFKGSVKVYTGDVSTAKMRSWKVESIYPASLQPNPDIYYGRSLYSANDQQAYDFILGQISTWEDNADQIGQTSPMKTIDFTGQDFKIHRDTLKEMLLFMKSDVQQVYTQFPPARNVQTDGNGNVLSMSYRFNRIPSFVDYQNEIKIIEEQVSQILEQIQPDMTEAQKVRLLHDELLTRVRYGMSTPGVDDIRGAFIHNIVLCEGYARALVYLLQLAGIESIYVTGHTDQGLHAWLKVKVDGLWYNIDPTWNDGISGNGVYHSYFLKADANFTDHIPDQGGFQQPLPTDNLATADYPLAETEYQAGSDGDNNSGEETAMVIYSDANQQGDALHVTEDMAFVGEMMNDNMSSFVIPAGWTVRFFENANYQGRYFTRDSDSSDRNFVHDFNDQVSSIKILAK